MQLYRSFFIAVLFLFNSSVIVLAQPKTPAKTPQAKPLQSPLKLSVKFGPYTDSSKPFATDLKRALNTDLKVTDNKNGNWTIVTYRFGWRKRDLVEDPQTGAGKTVYHFNATTVDNSSKIPDSWQEEMKNSLQPTEQLFFEEIIVQDVKTKKMMKAPALKLVLQ